MRIFVAVPSTGTVHAAHNNFFRKLEAKYAGRVEFVFPKHTVKRMFHDFARNALCDEFLNESDADILWFLDSDVLPPDHVLDLVLDEAHEWKVAGAPYPVFMVPPGGGDRQVCLFTVYTKVDEKLVPSNIPQEGKAWVDGLATGCLFIRREVFTELERPYFEFKYDEVSRDITEGEDLGFCRKMQALGYQFLTDFGMVCNHYKTVGLLDVNNYAIEYANRSVMQYDAQVKAQVQAAIEAAYQKGLKDGAKPKGGLILPSLA
jgi:hypothetical protein